MTNLKQNSESPSLATYVKKDLRRRFDDATEWQEAIRVIDEANSFGFTALAKEMISDFKTDPDCERLWNMHQDFINREMREGQDPYERQIEKILHSNGREL